MPDHAFLGNLLLTSLIALACIVGLARLRVPSIVAMIVAGVVAGPSGLSVLGTPEEVDALAEIGVVLLLFTVGLDFSMTELMRSWRRIVGGGLLQIGMTGFVVGAIALLAGASVSLATFLGAFIALSSTAIVIKGLAERNALDSPYGRLAVGVLLLQDLAVVLLLLLVPLLAGEVAVTEAPLVIGRALVALIVVAVLGRLVLPRLLRLVSASGRREAFPLAILLASLGTAWASSLLGVSMALGAFLGGLVLAGSEFSHQAHAEVRPLRDIFASLFFVSLGSLVDFAVVAENWPQILGLTVVIIFVKAAGASGGLLAASAPLRVALTAGIALSQVGEFSFILGRSALDVGLLAPELWQVLLASSIVTMVLTPTLLELGPRVAAYLGRGTTDPRGLGEIPRGHVIILGFGEGGKMIAATLRKHGQPYVVLELNGDTVQRARAGGEPLLYGDATNADALHGAGIEHAQAVVIVVSDPFAAARATAAIRHASPTVPILVRTRYRLEVEQLRKLGATVAVAEEMETSLEVLSQLLTVLHVPGNQIEADLDALRRVAPGMRRIEAPAYPLDQAPPEVGQLPINSHQLEASSWAVGRTLAETQLRGRTGVTVLALQADTGYLAPPPIHRPLQAGDILYLIGSREAVALGRRLLTGGPAVAGLLKPAPLAE